ncbi:hypothetical protein HEMROJRC1_20800 [Rodentibacter sp. JRC1]|uniref:hypothetical protein n=1 Tax=Rodentibacter sp. JRC1 TaxID=2874504 RepID=UPI001CFDC0FC|nr:hypothetical protein [Rodentibacter sp. JRC1]GJI56968.1 hypothetical protein HEMROJRC1_20800 [Rodentibacter sp. JRC1]
MKKLRSFFKKLKDKVGFRVMTKDEYQEYLKKKGHFGSSDSNSIINPATGSPMVGNLYIGSNSHGSSRSLFESSSTANDINPATGLPMSGGVDVCGNPYGIDLNNSTDNSFSYSNDTYNNDFHNT